MPYQPLIANPVTPVSATVGTSGKARSRLSLETASARTWPELDEGAGAGNAGKIHIDVIADDADHGRAAALIRDVHEGFAEQRRQQRTGQMRRAAGSGRRKGNLFAGWLSGRLEITDVLNGDCGDVTST